MSKKNIEDRINALFKKLVKKCRAERKAQLADPEHKRKFVEAVCRGKDDE